MLSCEVGSENVSTPPGAEIGSKAAKERVKRSGRLE